MANKSEEPEGVIFTDISALTQDISLLYMNEKFSDVTLSFEGQKIHAHKVILAARSEYFEALLFDDLQNSSQPEITVGGGSLESFQLILKYIYTGSISIAPSKITLTLEVMGLAHQYLLKDLESTIMQKHQLILNLKNVCPILNAANLYDLIDLRDACHVILDQHASEILASDDCFNELTQMSLVKLLERDAFLAPEIDIFKRVAKWCEVNNDVDNLVKKCVRLSQLTVVQIVAIVWPSKLIDNEILLSAISEIVEVTPKTTRSRVVLLREKNLATPEMKLEVIFGKCTTEPKIIFSGNRDTGKYMYHPIGSGDENGITIKLGAPSFINHIYMMLWDGDDRFYCYYIEVSTDQKTWKKVIDYRHAACRSVQNLFFDQEIALYIRVVGTRNTRHHDQFHLVFLEVFYKDTIPRVVNGVTCPNTNVATSEKKATVMEGLNPQNLFENIDGSKGYTYHKIGSGHIVIELAQPYIISTMKFRLWDGDDRVYKYYIEISLDQTNWEIVVDRRNENCKTWQTARFTERPVVFIRITGTSNNRHPEEFHLFHFECPADEK